MKMRTGWQKPRLLSVFLLAAIIGAAFFYFTSPVLASDGGTVGSTVIVPEKGADSDTESTDVSSEAGENTTPSGTKDRTGNGALTPEGSMSLVDDEDEGSGLQFITLTSRNGHYFYLVIDRSSSVENVYFLNAVDESDLLSVMSGEELKAYEDAQKEEADKKTETDSTWNNADLSQDILGDASGDDSDALNGSVNGSVQDTQGANKEAASKKVSVGRMAVTIIIFLLGVGGILAGIYLIRKKEEKEAEHFDDDEEITFPEEKEE